MAKRYVWEGCNKGCKYGVVHTCEQVCGDCMVRVPCKYAGHRKPCYLCNRRFSSQTCFDKHKKTTQSKRKNACGLRKCCGTFGALITRNTHECNKRFSATCKENKEAGNLCLMRPLVNLPASSERVLYVFYDFETTQDTNCSLRTNKHVPNLVCLQQFCSKCENISDIQQDCILCCKRIHSFWEDPVGDMLNYLCESRLSAEKIVVIAHNAMAFDVQFIVN